MDTSASGTQEWLHWVQRTSHPLVQLGKHGQVSGIASATLLKFENSVFLLTARHIDTSKDWVLRVSTTHAGMNFYRPRQENFIDAVNYSRSRRDFAISDLVLCPLPPDFSTQFQERTPIYTGEPVDRHVFDAQDVVDPTESEIYAFGGEVGFEKHGSSAYVTDPTVYPGLRFLEEKRHVCRFRLPVPHPGHEHFKGCSGAPIVDQNRRVAAIVVHGHDSDNTIGAVRVGPYIDLLRAVVEV